MNTFQWPVFISMTFGSGCRYSGDCLYVCSVHSGINQDAAVTAVMFMCLVSSYILCIMQYRLYIIFNMRNFVLIVRDGTAVDVAFGILI